MGRESSSAPKERYPLLDAARGACLISMILYHAVYDLTVLFGVSVPWFWQSTGYLWQQSICWAFILLSGMCWSLGRHPIKRGLQVFACGALITAVTALCMPSQLVLFGILTFLGFAMLLMTPAERLLRHVPPAAGLVFSLLLFFVLRNLNRGQLGFEQFVLLRFDPVTIDSYALELLGLPTAGFFSTDYFSLFPWFFLYLTGYFLWQIFWKLESVRSVLRFGVPGLNALGRQTLPVYMLHQPVLMALFTGIGFLV